MATPSGNNATVAVYICQWVQNIVVFCKTLKFMQLESHFATINCHTVALRRVESPGAAVRIMATAEVISAMPHSLFLMYCWLFQDGCVRLLSPVTGQVITILFPVFTSTVSPSSLLPTIPQDDDSFLSACRCCVRLPTAHWVAFSLLY